MKNQTNRLDVRSAFTLLEILIVVFILGIAALVAVPMMSTAADVQVRSAAQRLAADLEYAKSLAVTHQKPHTVVFWPDQEKYEVRKWDGAAAANPLEPARSLTVEFAKTHGLNRVAIDQANFVSSSGTENAITFDYLGAPYSGATVSAASALVSGAIVLKDTAGQFQVTVSVEPMTGYISIDSP